MLCLASFADTKLFDLDTQPSICMQGHVQAVVSYVYKLWLAYECDVIRVYAMSHEGMYDGVWCDSDIC